MGVHIVDGEFQSDKYPSTPRGKVPLSVKDKAAQPLLWQYAQTHRKIDAEFSDDLETALRAAGYSPPTVDDDRVLVIRARLAAGTSWTGEDGGHGNKVENQEPEVRRILRDCARRIEELAGVALDAKAHAVADCFVHEHEELTKKRVPVKVQLVGPENRFPLCEDEGCPERHECANHCTAGDYRTEDGLTPDLRYTEKSWECSQKPEGYGPRLADGTVARCEPELGQLAELHAIATAHNPRPPSPEHRTRVEAYQRELAADPEKAKRAWGNLMRALDARDPMSLSERTKCEALWDAWDTERDPQAKTILLLRLGETVAQWMTHAEALERALKSCAVDEDNPDTCGVCGHHFADCEVDHRLVGDDDELACAGARARAALSAT